jgi:hypothetical protein
VKERARSSVSSSLVILGVDLILRWVCLLGLVVSLAGCFTSSFGDLSGFDQRILTIQTASLFNQKAASRVGTQTWNGDWIFRRDRLVLIDDALRNVKPDIVVLQEVMTKRGSSSESDRNILQAGALEDFVWRESDAIEYDDTQEIQSLAVAAAPSLGFVDQDAGQPERDFWKIGNDGFLMASVLQVEGQPVLVFNVQMPLQLGQKYLWYTFLEERIAEWTRIAGTCRKRVVVAGYLPGDQDSKRFNDMTQRLELKDASTGFCQVASNCYTATSLNEMFMATQGDEIPSQADRILLHQSALVSTSSRNLTDSEADARWSREFGLTRVWATQRFGWVVSARLARCGSADLLQ